MGLFLALRAILVRFLFSVHGLMCIWRLYIVTNDPRYWCIAFAIVGAILEAILTIKVNRGNEWKWCCPSVFFYLLSAVPAIWFLELNELDKRIRLQKSFTNTSVPVPLERSEQNETLDDITRGLRKLGVELVIPIKLSSDQWVKALEQLLLLLLIVGRWMLPKGKLTHDQLSQLLLVYIGTAADIVEFFDAFKEDEVKYNRVLCMSILGIWSWSLMQFTMVLTATKARKDKSGVFHKKSFKEQDTCCTPDVYGIVISILMQDIPFLILRMLLIFHYGVLSYTNMFFTCKNALVVALLMYRLSVVQLERRNIIKHPGISASDSYSTSRFTNSTHSLSDFLWTNKTVGNIRDYVPDPSQPDLDIKFTVKRHHRNNVSVRRSQSVNEMRRGTVRLKEQYSLDEDYLLDQPYLDQDQSSENKKVNGDLVTFATDEKCPPVNTLSCMNHTPKTTAFPNDANSFEDDGMPGVPGKISVV